ncbi:hypothetical protein [uncultured Bacteroides sp.]|uniref:hypothetical protein n=1 Tax=uncultured Bacteroides sp. TaxID=162156 RepID=UPI00262E8DFD|nr:hypothetical protein [uncultured Bacteroides sp.]
MKKNILRMLLMTFLTMAGLAACSDDDGENLTSIAKTEWYGSHVVTTTTNEGVEKTYTAILGFIFSEDGTSCIVETGIETLISTNRVTKYVNYSPLTHSVTLTESSNSSMTEYLGVIDDESMLVQHCVNGKLSNEVIKLFKKSKRRF